MSKGLTDIVSTRGKDRKQRAKKPKEPLGKVPPPLSDNDLVVDRPALRRRKPGISKSEVDDEGRQFVNGLARGLDVLSAFRRGDPPLGNQELAERTGIPKPTVSRLAYTLTRVGYLSYNSRSSTYELGGAALSLGFVAQSNPDVRNVARPLLQKVASMGSATVGLGVRDRLKMLYLDVYEGEGMVGLRLSAGSHIPLGTTAFGRAYLAALADSERDSVLDELKASVRSDWAGLKKAIEHSIKEVNDRGFCIVQGAWSSDVSGVGAPILRPNGMAPCAINVGGPSYMLSGAILNDVYGPNIAAAARKISTLLGGAGT